MRLIDVDELIEMIEGTEELLDFQKDECIACINACDVAYDVEKVVAELEEEREKCQKEMEECIFKGLPYHDSTEGKVIGIKKSIEIVRNGGKE